MKSQQQGAGEEIILEKREKWALRLSQRKKGMDGGEGGTKGCNKTPSSAEKKQSGPSAASVFARVHTGVLLPSRH